MTCIEAGRLQEAFLALELDATTEGELRRHLHDCDACRAAVAAVEPAMGLALALAAKDVAMDPTFVGEVLAGVHQRAFERRFSGRRRRWIAVAAALILAAFGGWSVLRRAAGPAGGEVAEVVRVSPPAAEPAFVEVEGDGVRLYQFDTAQQEPVKVAFIIDPQLEL